MKNILIGSVIAFIIGVFLSYKYDDKDMLFFSRPFLGRNIELSPCRIFFIENASFFHHESDKRHVLEHASLFADYYLKDKNLATLYYFKSSIWSRDENSRRLLANHTIEDVASEDFNFIFTMKSAFFCEVRATKSLNGKINLTIDENFNHLK